LSFRGSERVLSKSLKSDYGMDIVATEIMSYEDRIDVPAFMRKAHQKEI